MNIEQWAIKHHVSIEALSELRQMFGMINTDPEITHVDMSEAAVQTRIRLEASRLGLRLWRNNVGATYTEDGRFLRYGLVNDSKRLNDTVKSSDLIGIRPLMITPGHVGCIIGQFVAREVKESKWKYSGTTREVAQLKFLELVLSMGGDAAFANSEGTL